MAKNHKVISQLSSAKSPQKIKKKQTSPAKEKVTTIELSFNETFFRALIEHSNTAIALLDREGNIIYDSSAASGMLGYGPTEWIGKNVFELVHPDDLQKVQTLFANLLKKHEGQASSIFRVRHKDNHWVWLDVVATNLLTQPNMQAVVVNYRDITQNKKAEEILSESVDRFREVWEITSDAMALSDSEGIVFAANPAYYALYAYTPQQVLGQSFAIIFPEEFRQQAITAYKQVFNSDIIPPTFESVIHRADGTERNVESRASFLTSAGQRTAMLSTIRDISERKQAEATLNDANQRAIIEYEQLLERLNTLAHLMGTARDIPTVFRSLLQFLLASAPCSGLFVSQYDEGQQERTCIYAWSEGEEYDPSTLPVMPMTDSPHSRAVATGEIIVTGNLAEILNTQPHIDLGLEHDPRLPASSIAVPMSVRGRVIGGFEVQSTQPDAYRTEHITAMRMAATLAAISMENVQLLDHLQRSNMDLNLAYDATIVGWSAAMDLRDKETEGHSQRVTEMTVKLSHRMGIPDSGLLQIRRGALLHDIGKLGIPDHILLKPDKLTKEEWEIMQKHPVDAYDMLSSIAYLKEALDIPYCHHEKWDGSGYPRQLKGEAIPLAARIFAIVDVWDALTSDRPYRPAWTREHTLEHIKEQSGIHFDPQVVEAFFKMINDQ